MKKIIKRKKKYAYKPFLTLEPSYRSKRIEKVFRKDKDYAKDRIKNLLKTVFFKPEIKYKINIKIIPNNIFGILTKFDNNKTLHVTSTGKLKLKTTKRKLKFVSGILIKKFIDRTKKIICKSTTLLVLSGPVKIKKKILTQILKTLKGNKLIIDLPEKKCFNGCRPKKKRRKKRKGLRIRR